MPWLPGLAAVVHPCSYKKLAQDVAPGSSILCADGSIVLEVVSTDPASGTVKARCKNTAMLG
jgi:pyruvate kinase